MSLFARFANCLCFGIWILWLCASFPDSQVRAVDDDIDGRNIPIVGRPTADFYNAIGTGVMLRAEASPTELSTDRWLTFTLTIEKLANAPDVEKPSLKALKDFERFQIEESSELDPKINPEVLGRRVFVYRLRPSSPNVTLIPEIAFCYFDPKRRTAPDRSGDRFPKTFSNAVPIRVKPAPAKPRTATIAPLDVPPFAQHVATSDNVLSLKSSVVPNWIWMLAIVVPPLLAVGWVHAWRSLYPDAAKLTRIKKNKAVRKALGALTAERRKPSADAAGSIAEILNRYLRERFDLPDFARTPAEIGDHIRSIDWPDERIARIRAFFICCDAARFAPAHFAVAELADDAEQIIIAQEESA